MRADIKFWGVRGSIATGPSKFGSNTSCVELDFHDGNPIFFDAGTGIRAATQDREIENLTLFISHFHWDHIQGLPFIGCLNKADTQIEIITAFEDVESRLNHLFDARFHPVGFEEYSSRIRFKILEPGEVYEHHGLRLETGVLNHPGKSYAYKLSSNNLSFMYATDSDYDPVPPEASKLFMQSDWVVVDSQFLLGDSLEKAHYGHSSFKHAIDTCAEHRVKNCLLYHFDPNYSDKELSMIEKQAQDHALQKYGDEGPRVKMAVEGESISLNF